MPGLMSLLAMDMFQPEPGWDDFYPLSARFLSSPPYATHRTQHHHENSDDDSKLRPFTSIPRRRNKTSRRRSGQRAGFRDLPADVLHILARYLDTPSRLCLSLTCRESYYFFFANALCCTLPHQRERLLIMHERDPHARQHYYCFPCALLHPLTDDCAPKPKLIDNKVIKCDGDDHFCPIRNHYPLSWTHARLVMNAHIYGPDFGLPLSSICQPLTVPCGPAVLQCETEAKIRNQRLLLRRTYTFTVPYRQLEEFQDALIRNRFQLCSHTKLINPPAKKRTQRNEEKVVLSKREPSWHTIREFVYNDNVEGSCDSCATDYVLQASPFTDAQGRVSWKIIAFVYHMLGSCRSPEAWKWARFAERSERSSRENRLQRKSTSMKNGDVFDEWFADEPGGEKYKAAKPDQKVPEDGKPRKKSRRRLRREQRRLTEMAEQAKRSEQCLKNMDGVPRNERPRKRFKFAKFGESDWKAPEPDLHCFLFLAVLAFYVLFINHLYSFAGQFPAESGLRVDKENETFWIEHVLRRPNTEL